MSPAERCKAHGWTLSPTFNTTNPVDGTTVGPKVYDAVIFSVEMDMLEIRIRELWDVVDKFVILESNATFTGHYKEQVFSQNRKRFEFAESKILYKAIPLYELTTEETAWDNEIKMRRGMSDFLYEIGVETGDFVITSDVDEIISKNAIQLLKSCDGIPTDLHVQLRNYLYSFEFPVNDEEGSWRASVHKWTRGVSRYVHGKSSNNILTNAGWHCSFCFRTIEEFQFKMKAYSHSDRVRYEYLMESAWIQEAICAGKDLFGMFPEAYSFRDLFLRLGAIPKSKSAVGLPYWILENRDRFKFLLPGGCQRGGNL
ncbi:hypothetical protein BGZ76_004023 [Entomortierella beljakovae]|nr:hypothetical protein BGZ76_004023 [Entomortierella beljakovae]